MNFFKCTCITIKLPTRFCCLSLRTIGFSIGWLGVVYRTISLTIFSVLLSKVESWHPNIYDLSLSILVGYSALSLIANVLLLIGIFKEAPLLMLPYMTLEFLEIIVLCIAAMAGAIMLPMLDLQLYLFAAIPAALAFIGLYIYLWLCLVQLFKTLEQEKYTAKNGKKAK